MAGNVLAVLPATSTSELIFGKPLPATAETAEKEKSIIPKDFFWDQFVKYLASAIALLTALDVAVQFLRDANLLCYPPLDEKDTLDVSSRDQAAYINTFCLDSLSRSEFYSVFILIEGIFIAGPHYLWSTISGGQLDFFFSIVEQLDRLRDPMVGEYRPRNFDFVRKLEKEFPTKKKMFGIFRLYQFKLGIQVIVASIAIILNGSVFQPPTFRFSFQCPESCVNDSSTDAMNCSIQNGWPFSFTVWCIYPSFRVLWVIWWVNFFLVLAALVMTGYGLVWTFRRHTNALGHERIAKFAFASCLTPGEYVFEPFLRSPFNPSIRSDLDFLLLRLFRADTGHGQVFKDILVAKELKRLVNEDQERLNLFINALNEDTSNKTITAVNTARAAAATSGRSGAGPGSGEATAAAFQNEEQPPPDNGMESNQLRIKFLEGKFTKNLEKEVFSDLGRGILGNVETEFEELGEFRDIFYGLLKYINFHNKSAHDIFFGTVGYTFILARPFRNVLSLNFHPFYRNAKEVVKTEMFQANYTRVTWQDDIRSQAVSNINKSEDPIIKELRGLSRNPDRPSKPINLAVVGPFTEKAKRATVSLHIQRLNDGQFFAKKAVLITVRPLKIRGKDVSCHFYKYEPPEGLFQNMMYEISNGQEQDSEEPVNRVLEEVIGKHLVIEKLNSNGEIDEDGANEIWGIKIKCADVDCVFEFVLYRYVGKHVEPAMSVEECRQQDIRLGHAPEELLQPALTQPGFRGLSDMESLSDVSPDNEEAIKKSGCIALVIPAHMAPKLAPDHIERFLAGDAAIQLSNRREGAPIQFVMQQSAQPTS